MRSLTEQQIATLKTGLDNRSRELSAEIRAELAASDDEQHRNLANAAANSNGESLDRAFVDVEVALIDRQVKELRDIEAARQRMHNGAYGTCADCEEAVPYARLLAYPIAKRCITCQQEHDKTHAHENTPRL